VKSYTKISWDWKTGPSREDLEAALKPFGILVYQDPTLVGSDCFSYILTNEPLTLADLREIEATDGV
jgi:hypothetical protein